MNEDEVKDIIEKIYQGLINLGFLPISLYLFTSNKLLSGVYSGYGMTLEEVVEKQIDHRTLYNLSRNIYQFSAAKTFQNVYDLQSIIYKDGFKVPFNEFSKQATTILGHYNKNWLEVEYNAAVMSSNAASQWEGILKTSDQFPLLKYQTVGDGRVRPEHARLDGIVKPVNDPFWNTAYPPNSWRCRCDVIQLVKGEAEITKFEKGERHEIVKEIPKVFRNNPYKSGQVFNDHHPYFDVPEKYESLKKANFNLPIPI